MHRLEVMRERMNGYTEVAYAPVAKRHRANVAIGESRAVLPLDTNAGRVPDPRPTTR
jgi:hypothetical protein